VPLDRGQWLGSFGSHHIYSKPGERKTISIPIHGNRDLKPGLANRIARDAGIEL